MQVLALNSSPHGHRGGTALILNPFLEGMAQAGAQVEQVEVHRLTIKPCLGCFSCWLKTPGTCVQSDDMADLLPRFAAADAWVFATPVYVDGMTGTMKTLLDRMIPLVEPFFETRDDHCRHPRRKGVKSGTVALVSVSGFTELDNFEPLVAHIQAACKNMDRVFAGALLRPYAAALPGLAKMGGKVDGVYEAARRAGRELVRSGDISAATLDAVSCELVSREVYVRLINQHFRRQLAELSEA